MCQARYRNMEERLIANSVVDDATGCWIWIGNRDSKGYGRVAVRKPGKKSPTGVRAHRASYEEFIGPIPANHTLDHFVCQNESCIHPNHVEPVTNEENLRRQHFERRRRAADER